MAGVLFEDIFDVKVRLFRIHVYVSIWPKLFVCVSLKVDNKLTRHLAELRRSGENICRLDLISLLGFFYICRTSIPRAKSLTVPGLATMSIFFCYVQYFMLTIP